MTKTTKDKYNNNKNMTNTKNDANDANQKMIYSFPVASRNPGAMEAPIPPVPPPVPPPLAPEAAGSEQISSEKSWGYDFQPWKRIDLQDLTSLKKYSIVKEEL